MNFFEQIWTWVSANIVPVLSSTTFLTVITFVVYFVRTRKLSRLSNVDNANLMKELTTVLRANDGLKNEVAELQAKVLDIADTCRQLTVKEDGMLAVMQTVYSGLKHEVSSTVNNIINNVKYNSSQTRNDIADDLDAALAAQKAATKAVEEKIHKTKRTIGKDDKQPVVLM